MKSISTTRVGHKVKGSKVRYNRKPFNLKIKCLKVSPDQVGDPALFSIVSIAEQIDRMIADEEQRRSHFPACLRPR